MTRTDRKGNEIGNGNFHAHYYVIEIEGVQSSISKSETTESVYVTYNANGKSITCRFSNHENNAVAFGDQLDGYSATANEIKFELGLINRTFVPQIMLSVPYTQVKKVEVANYEECEVTIQEIYAMGAGASISQYKGKVAKGSNYLILGDVIKSDVVTKRNILGQSVMVGSYDYAN